ncbi:zinc finger protein [Sesbania bispinosa]|nr:zinc finger protein [Sesbania bispinosa]
MTLEIMDIHIAGVHSRTAGNTKKIDTVPSWKIVNEQHIANRFRYSLRVYLSMLYLRIPESFNIILRGQVVKLHNIADDLKYTEFILYKPQSGGSEEAIVVTTIGFLKEAPEVNIHGFNVYHKNRLILPFWKAVNYSNNKGRGVVGILQADHVEPTHNKQDFERTPLFQKLEARLKDMTLEYWYSVYASILLCTWIAEIFTLAFLQSSLLLMLSAFKTCARSGQCCRVVKHGAPVCRPISSLQKPLVTEKPVVANDCSSSLQISNTQTRSEQASLTKRKTDEFIDLKKMKRQAMEENVTGVGCNHKTIETPTEQVVDPKVIKLLGINKNFRARCLEYEKAEEELNLKVTQLRSKIQEAQNEYNRLLAEVQSPDMMPKEV